MHCWRHPKHKSRHLLLSVGVEGHTNSVFFPVAEGVLAWAFCSSENQSSAGTCFLLNSEQKEWFGSKSFQWNGSFCFNAQMSSLETASSGPHSKLSTKGSRIMAVQIPCRWSNYNVQPTASEFGYLPYFVQYLLVSAVKKYRRLEKCMSWLLQLTYELVFALLVFWWANSVDLFFPRALRSDPKSSSAGGRKKTSSGGSRTFGSWSSGCFASQGRAGETKYWPDKEPGTAGKTRSLLVKICYATYLNKALESKGGKKKSSNLYFVLNFLFSLY